MKRKTVRGGSHQQAGSGALTWTAEPPRAGGWWWLRLFGDQDTAGMVNVFRAGGALRVKIMEMILRVDAPKLAEWRAEWAGPVEPPTASSAETRQNEALCEVGGDKPTT